MQPSLTRLRATACTLSPPSRLATGMRRGELLALQWGDIDLDRGVLRVERSVEETKAGGLRLKSPKTKRGRRNIGLPVEAVAMLRAHKVKQLELRLLLGLGNIVADTLVFSTLEGRAAVAQQCDAELVASPSNKRLAAGQLPQPAALARLCC